MIPRLDCLLVKIPWSLDFFEVYAYCVHPRLNFPHHGMSLLFSSTSRLLVTPSLSHWMFFCSRLASLSLLCAVNAQPVYAIWGRFLAIGNFPCQASDVRLLASGRRSCITFLLLLWLNLSWRILSSALSTTWSGSTSTATRWGRRMSLTFGCHPGNLTNLSPLKHCVSGWRRSLLTVGLDIGRILQAGDWKRLSTFQSHYFKPQRLDCISTILKVASFWIFFLAIKNFQVTFCIFLLLSFFLKEKGGGTFMVYLLRILTGCHIGQCYACRIVLFIFREFFYSIGFHYNSGENHVFYKSSLVHYENNWKLC